MSAPKHFELIDLPKKAFLGQGTQYRVYKPDGTFVDVSAENVQDAIKASGVADAVKLHRLLLTGFNILDSTTLKGGEMPTTPNTAPPEAASQPTA